jgi:hypothetical protein
VKALHQRTNWNIVGFQCQVWAELEDTSSFSRTKVDLIEGAMRDIWEASCQDGVAHWVKEFGRICRNLSVHMAAVVQIALQDQRDNRFENLHQFLNAWDTAVHLDHAEDDWPAAVNLWYAHLRVRY